MSGWRMSWTGLAGSHPNNWGVRRTEIPMAEMVRANV